MAQINFNPLEHNPNSGFDVLPEGDYVGIIKETEVKNNKAGTGAFLQIQIEILKGEHTGRRVFDIFNLKNDNATAVKIAQESLSALCHALGKLNPIRDSDELKGVPFGFRLGVDPANRGKDGKDYPAKNVVKKYLFKKEENATTVPATAAVQAMDDDHIPF